MLCQKPRVKAHELMNDEPRRSIIVSEELWCGSYLSEARDVANMSETMNRKLPMFWKLFGKVRKIVTTSKALVTTSVALVTTSVALVPSSFLLLLVRHLLLLAWHLFLVASCF